MKQLEEYRQKRDFHRTSEPAGGARAKTGTGLRFCVQKHDASHLHYDFRLELGGVLKSWAVPKGPSLDPGERRLAVEVEDHPLNYRTFEGMIPKGSYGAGTVLLWDEGVWIPEGDARADLRRGRLRFELRGSKLEGRWSLIRMKGRAERDNGKTNWLLIKSRDSAARVGADLLQERPESVKASARKSRAAKLPDFIPPPLATRVAHSPAGNEWIHEIKFDGYRVQARLDGRKLTLRTRSGKDWTARFPQLKNALAALSARGTILDGEIVALDARGVSHFESLQQAISEGKTKELLYQIFDVPFLEGRDLRKEPLLERKKALAQFLGSLGKTSPLRYTDHVVGSGEAFQNEACRMLLEGIVSKRADSPYISGRGENWVKAKCDHAQEFVIAGFTDPAGSREALGALLLGYYENADLIYAGRVGTGFDTMILRELREWLGAMERRTSAFSRGPAPSERRGVHWVKPQLVAQVRFMGWTQDGRLRHPSFVAIREDKPAAQITREPVQSAPVAAAPRELKPPGRASGVAGVVISHPDRLVFPEQRLTKRDVALFYEKIASWILPHLAGRPLSLLRCPQGREGACFFQKHWDEKIVGVKSVRIREKSGTVAYPVIDSLPGLIALVQRGVLEFHPWGSRAAAVERPDRLTFDLDPSPELSWPDVVDAAREIRERLARLELRSYVKTTGGKGLHVVVPFTAGPSWDEARTFSKAFAALLAREQPRRYTATISKQARAGKIFVDWLRNGRGATAVAAYSIRARANAPVATPLVWEELASLSRSDAFTVRNLLVRLETLRNPWADFGSLKQKLPRA